jgi:hypothetical protein
MQRNNEPSFVSASIRIGNEEGPVVVVELRRQAFCCRTRWSRRKIA